jgi:hypothetical protein
MACYSLLNCDGITTTTIDYALGGLTVGNVITVSPTIPIPGVTNCWEVSEALPECTGGENIVTSIYDHGAAPDGCTDCEAIVPIRLKNCEDEAIIINVNYTSLPAFTTISINPVPADYIGLANCWTIEGPGFLLPENSTITSVTDVGSCEDCLNPPTCYTLENCIDTNVTLNVTSVIALPPAPNAFELSPTPTAPNVPAGTPNCWRVVTEKPCDGSELSVTVVTSYETCNDCMLDKQCYALTKCGDPGPTVYTKSNLLAYVGTQITSPELGGNCYTVALSPTCILPVVLNTALITSCSCPPAGNCYLLSLCDSDGTITLSVNIVPPATLVVGNVYNIFPVPTIPPGYENCWEVIELITCETGFYGVESVNSFDDCTACQTPPTCYKLTGCDDTVIYTQNALIAPYLNSYVQLSAYPGKCFFVTTDGTCPSPVTIIGTLSSCSCPCYILTDCFDEVPPIYTYSNLAAYVGTQVHINEDGGCEGPCYTVELSTVPCPLIAPTITVTPDCPPCPECKPTICFPLIDCITKAPYIVLSNPTSNGVDLTLNVGDVISKICTDADQTACVYGCWEVGPATENCETAVLRYVYNIYDNCTICTSQCYEFVSCETELVAYTILDQPNPYGLPSLASLVGQTITGLCFDRVCPPGCFYVRKKENGDCTMSTGYNLITALAISPTFCCQGQCYLVTPCDGSMEPFTVSNDLSAYVGEVINACFTVDDEQVCKCLQVIRANSCEDSIVLDTIIDSFETCEDCKYCGCPEGYTKVDDQCQKIVTVPAVLSPIVFTVTEGSKNQLYGTFGTRFYANISALPGPFTQSGTNFLDAGSVPLPFTTNTTGVWGPGLLTSRLNTVGVWTGAAPNPVNEWIGFTHCVTLAQTGTYCVAVAGDNGVRFSLDGVLLVNAPNNIQFNFEYWHVFELTLTAGTHVIAVEGYNYGGPAAFGAEIYNATAALLQTFTTPAQLQNPAITVFSTFDKIDETFDIGEDSGYTCPDGYTFSLCDGSPECTGIQTTPFIECPPTYKVTLCAGQGVSYDPIITNTDLSAYIGVSKVCIENPTFSTTNYILKDCNGIVADICTTTLLGNSLWDSIILTDYPGSCFIVTGVIEGESCTDPIQVATLQEPCVCKPVGTPWPDGCYCVTVEEIPSQTGIDFYGTFGESFQCCEDCKQVCYLLTSCLPGINPVIVCNDLAAYVDPPRVIKITGCGDICWNVAIASTCNTSTYFGGTIIDYADCPACLPPLPPTPPPYDLHLRKIKPGYNSPNSCYSTNTIEKINCTFANQVYNAMLVKRYGVTVCCEEDLMTWDIKKQLMDLDLLNDPSLCKSTLCHCPEPCLISAIITVLPTCVAPYLIRATLDPLCFPPVLESVEIIVDSSLPCYCYTVEIQEVGPTPIIVGYVDCCCKDVITLYDEVTTVNMCALYPPVTSEPSSTNVTSSGLCSDLCVVEPPVCICWQVINTGYEGGLSANITYTPCGSETPVVFRMVAEIISVCSYNVPTGVTPDEPFTVNNLGPCSSRCDEGCKCFFIEFDEPDADFEIFNCETKTIQITNTASGAYLCSGTVPIAIGTLANLSITLVDPAEFTCSIGPLGLRCNPVPIVCPCWGVELLDGQTANGNCGTPTSVTNNTGTAAIFYICSTTLPTPPGGVSYTIAPFLSAPDCSNVASQCNNL